MRRLPIPQLVFATRSPNPTSGSDFVRQIVATQGEVPEAAEADFALRADLAGSVLRARSGEEAGALRLYFFSRLEAETWLFARAISLGLYRKGSHQFLVHGVLLPEEALDWLEGNPFFLASEAAAQGGFRFLDRHPGQRAALTGLELSETASEAARHYNRSRLAAIPAQADGALAAAYDRVARGAPVACVADDPHPRMVEALLLHFHPDDRRELSFHTFYSQSRRSDYRILGLLEEDLEAARRQISGLEVVSLSRPPAGDGEIGLGQAAARLRRWKPERFAEWVEAVRLTHLSRRRTPPLSPAEAAFALTAALDPRSVAALEAGPQRLDKLRLRAAGGLVARVEELAAVWRHRPATFASALDTAAGVGVKLRGEELESVLVDRLGDFDLSRRWALAALLARESAWVAESFDERRRWSVVRRLLDDPAWEALLAQIDAHGSGAEPVVEILVRWAVAEARFASLSSGPRPYWGPLLVWMGRQEAPGLGSLLQELETALVDRPPSETAPAWRLLGDLCLRFGRTEDRQRLFFEHGLPALPREHRGPRLLQEVDRLCRDEPPTLALVAGNLRDPEVAPLVFGRLADHLGVRVPRAAEISSRFAQGLARVVTLPVEALPEMGRYVAALAALPEASAAAVAGCIERAAGALAGGDGAARKWSCQIHAAAAARLRDLAAAPPLAEEPTGAARAACRLLEARTGGGPLTREEAPVMDLAVFAKVVADALPSGLGDDSTLAGRARLCWRSILELAVEGALMTRAGEIADPWLSLLQDELMETTEEGRSDAALLETFVTLAWRRWSAAAEGSAERRTLWTKLRWALTLGAADDEAANFVDQMVSLFRDDDERRRRWHRERMEEAVPESQRPAAIALLGPLQLEARGL